MVLKLSPPPPRLPSPAIAVIIPAYNREKYIGECLDSILEQTFQSFEVIVVDDASTDNTCAVVESYIPKFDGRLRLIRSEKNSGHPGEPRNKGISVASNEYIYCLDSDDTLTETALEEMHTLAKKFDADVVYCEKYFMSEGTGQEFKDKIHLADNRIQKPPFVEEPTLETDDLAERVKKLIETNYWMLPALRLVKRDLLIENRIKFPPLVGSEDNIWSMEVLFCSKRFLRIPNICFVRRIHNDGISFGEYTTPDHVQRWMDVTIRSLKDLDNFMNGIDFFRENPKFRYDILNRSVNGSFANIFKRCANESDFNVYKIFQEKFGEYLGENDVLVSCLCAYAVAQHNKSEKNIKKQIKAREEEIQQLKAKIESMTPLPALPSDVPAVSVIIPMYNTEKYIGECLDSLVAQTFQNFEVIVVDDCSTDNSCAIVKSYIAKFNGRLTILNMQENMGNGGLCRNKGFHVSHGEYIQFVDSDDVLTKTALEELYTLAKDYDADVVYCEKHYMSGGVGEDLFKNAVLATNLIQKPPYVDKPTFESEDLSERVKGLLHGRFGVVCWEKFIRRDLMQENELFFPHVRRSEDTIWSRGVVFCAKKILRVPNMVYIYRSGIASVTRGKKTAKEKMTLWLSPALFGLKSLDNFMSKYEFFRLNPSYRYALLKNFGLLRLKQALNFGKNLPEEEIYSIMKDEFGEKLGEYDVSISFLFAAMCAKEKFYEELQEFMKLSANFIARIDIKLAAEPATSDFQILSTSDSKAGVKKPGWLQKGGIGYVITSFVGKLEFAAKTTADGQIYLKLRGMDIRNPDDKSKRIPYWIDYTKFTVNGKLIFDKLTPAWHDKPFSYKLDVKADEEIKIEVEWLPHRSDT